jgi:hypothetical protein
MPFGKDREPDLAPTFGGVNSRAIGLKLDITIGHAKRLAGSRVLALPAAHQAAVMIANLANRVVANEHSRDLSQILRATLERPLRTQHNSRWACRLSKPSTPKRSSKAWA